MSDFVGSSFGGLALPESKRRKRRDADDLYVATKVTLYLSPAERRQLRQARILQLLVDLGQAKDLAEAAFIELKRAEAAL